MTILFLSHEDDKVMGSTLSLANMIHALQGQGCEAIVTLPGDGIARKYLERQSIRCITAHYHVDFVGRGNWLRRAVSFPYRFARDCYDHRLAIRSICRQVEGIHIDIVHTNTAVLDFGPKLAQVLGVPHVWHLREFIDQDMGFRPFLGWSRLRRLIQKADATISITQAIAQHYGVVGNPKGYILFDAVRSSKNLRHSEQKQPQFVFCGQLAPHKGPDLAIRAFLRLAQIHPDYKLLLMGTATDSKYEESLHALVPEDMKNRIQFLGYVQEPDRFLAQSIALLMCSRNEAQGRVTVEAMLQGCPVIAMNAGGTKEIIKDGFNGYLFDNEEGLFATMQDVISQPEKVRILAENAQSFAREHFLEESYGPKVIRIYNALLRK